jgi:hypothetical protein
MASIDAFDARHGEPPVPPGSAVGRYPGQRRGLVTEAAIAVTAAVTEGCPWR